MAEYIERESALALVQPDDPADEKAAVTIATAKKLIRHVLNNAPAADVASVVHGKWGTGRFNLETGNYEEQCTRCRNFSKEYDKPYCPNCGARMDGGAEDEVD